MLKRLGAAAVALSLASPLTAGAQDVAFSSQRAFANVTVNGIDDGEHTIVVMPNDVFLAVDDARTLKIPTANAAMRSFGGAPFVSLASLSPGVDYRFDETTIALVLNVAPTALGTTTTAVMQQTPPPDLDVSRPKSRFANYVLSGSTQGALDGFFDAGQSVDDHLLYASFSAMSGGALDRNSTSFSYDDVPHRRRTTFGDATFSGDELVGGVQYLGIGLSRAFELDPYLYRSASPSISGVVASPATAQIYINGVASRSVPLLPGGFDLTQLPVNTGQNDVAVVVRDAQGNVQRFDQSYFATPSLLRPGLTDYQYGLGFIRNPNPTLANYGPLGAYGSFRDGISDRATLGARLVSEADRAVAELSSDLRIPFGALHLAFAHSAARQTAGNALAADASMRFADTGVSADIAIHGSGFRDLTSVPEILAPALLDERVGVSERLGRLFGLTLQAERQTFSLAPSQTSANAVLNSTLGRDTTASITLQRTRVGAEGAPNTYVQLSLVRAFGPRRSAVVSAASGSTSVGYREEPIGSETGSGYGFQIGTAVGKPQLGFDTTDHLPFADVQTNGIASSGAFVGSLTVSGAVASIAGHTLPSRPIQDGFVLVDAGRAHLPITLDGRPAGRTDAHGFALVSDLAANGVNRLDVDGSGLGIADEVRTPERLVSPGTRGGSIARLRVARVTYVVGAVRLPLAGGGDAASEGTLFLNGPMVARSPLDDDGGYYFENLTPGTYAAHMRSRAGECSFALTVPSTPTIATDLGVHVCSPAR